MTENNEVLTSTKQERDAPDILESREGEDIVRDATETQEQAEKTFVERADFELNMTKNQADKGVVSVQEAGGEISDVSEAQAAGTYLIEQANTVVDDFKSRLASRELTAKEIELREKIKEAEQKKDNDKVLQLEHELRSTEKTEQIKNVRSQIIEAEQKGDEQRVVTLEDDIYKLEEEQARLRNGPVNNPESNSENKLEFDISDANVAEAEKAIKAKETTQAKDAPDKSAEHVGEIKTWLKEFKSAREKYYLAEQHLKDFKGVSRFFRSKQERLNAERQFEKAQREYESMRAEYIGSKMNRLLNEKRRQTELEAELEAEKNEEKGKIYKAYKKLGEWNVANLLGEERMQKLETKETDKRAVKCAKWLSRFGAKFVSARTAVSAGLLAGSWVLGAGAGTGAALLAGRRVMTGMGSGFMAHDFLKVKEELKATGQDLRLFWKFKFKANEEKAMRKKLSLEEAEKLSTDQLIERMEHFEVAGELNGISTTDHPTYKLLRQELNRRARQGDFDQSFDEIIKQDIELREEVEKEAATQAKKRKVIATIAGLVSGGWRTALHILLSPETTAAAELSGTSAIHINSQAELNNLLHNKFPNVDPDSFKVDAKVSATGVVTMNGHEVILTDEGIINPSAVDSTGKDLGPQILKPGAEEWTVHAEAMNVSEFTTAFKMAEQTGELSEELERLQAAKPELYKDLLKNYLVDKHGSDITQTELAEIQKNNLIPVEVKQEYLEQMHQEGKLDKFGNEYFTVDTHFEETIDQGETIWSETRKLLEQQGEKFGLGEADYEATKAAGQTKLSYKAWLDQKTNELVVQLAEKSPDGNIKDLVREGDKLKIDINPEGKANLIFSADSEETAGYLSDHNVSGNEALKVPTGYDLDPKVAAKQITSKLGDVGMEVTGPDGSKYQIFDWDRDGNPNVIMPDGTTKEMALDEYRQFMEEKSIFVPGSETPESVLPADTLKKQTINIIEGKKAIRDQLFDQHDVNNFEDLPEEAKGEILYTGGDKDALDLQQALNNYIENPVVGAKNQGAEILLDKVEVNPEYLNYTDTTGDNRYLYQVA